jgi:hypothetical protein
MHLFRSGAFVAASLLLLASPAAAQSTPVNIQFQDGNVTIRTSGRMPLRTVLQEWARVGGARIVNAEAVTATLDQIELVNVPEQKALAVLLRDIGGYAVGARDVSASGAPNGSPTAAARFDRIMLLPRSAPVTTGPRVSSVVSVTPPPPINFVPGDPDDDPNDVPPNGGRGLTPQQLQNNANVAAARAAAAAAQQQNGVRNPSEDVQRAPTPATPTTPTPNPFYSGRTGLPGQINPAPQRNPARPNGDPEP